MTDKEFKREIYKIICGNADYNYNEWGSDSEVIDRIRMYAEFREKIYEVVVGVGVIDVKNQQEEDKDKKWRRWALDNIS